MSELQANRLFSVNGLVAVVTGGGSGIGLMIVKALVANGAAKVYIIGRREEVLNAAVKEGPEGVIVPIVGDVTSKEDLKKAADQVRSDIGYVNVVFANSGIAGPQIVEQITPETPLAEFQAAMWNLDSVAYTNTFAVNVTAVWFTAIAFMELLHRGNEEANVQSKSQIIITSSIAGFNRQAPGGFPYGQSKSAVTLLTKQLASNLWPYGLRVNAIAPGLYPSDMSTGLIGDGPILKDRIPVERVGTEEDMAGAALYLTSRAGGYCNGEILISDGGRLSMMKATY